MAIQSAIIEGDHFFVGDRRTIQWTVYDRDEFEGRVPLDVTGWTFEFEMKRYESDTVVLISRPAFSAFDEPNGLVNVTPTPAETQDLPEAVYIYTLKRVDLNNERTLAFGGIKLHRASKDGC